MSSWKRKKDGNNLFIEQEQFSLAVSTYATLTAAASTWYVVRRLTHGHGLPINHYKK